MVPPSITPRVIFQGNKIGACFPIKDKTDINHRHDILYKVNCPNEECNNTYIGETGKRILERVKDHNGRDHNSHVLKQAIEYEHEPKTVEAIQNHDSGYKNHKAETLYIKQKRPALNIQDKLAPLKLFN